MEENLVRIKEFLSLFEMNLADFYLIKIASGSVIIEGRINDYHGIIPIDQFHVYYEKNRDLRAFKVGFMTIILSV